MKIACLVGQPLRSQLFTEKAMDKICSLGQVSFRDTENTDPDTLKGIIKNAEVVITSWGAPRLDKELLDSVPGLRLVAHAAGSIKEIVSDELFDRGIRIISSARALSRGVSEMALGLTIAAAKNVFSSNERIHQGEWPKDFPLVNELYEMTVGVVGCGYAGAHYAQLLKAFHVRTIIYDPLLSSGDIGQLGAEKVDLDTLLKESDIVSLHAPSIPETRHMIREDTLKLMKDRAILINTARGSLIDEGALAAAMSAGKLKYACLDVMDPEPPKDGNPLLGIPNCIFTPHVAGLYNNGKYKIGDHVYEEILRYRDGQPLETEVTKEMLSTIA